MKNVIIPIKLGVTIPNKKQFPFTYGNTKCVMYEGTPDVYKFLSKKYPEVEYKNVLQSQFYLVSKLGLEKFSKPSKKATPVRDIKKEFTNKISNIIYELQNKVDQKRYDKEDIEREIQRLNSSISTYNKLIEKIVDQIDKLSKHSGIESFDFDEVGIYIKTKKIITNITYPELRDDDYTGPLVTNTFDIGSYLICIPLDYKDIGIRIFNCDMTFVNYDDEGYQGWHITQDGIPCFGNMAGSILTFHKNMNLVALVPLIINYLNTFTYEREYAPYALPSEYDSRSNVDSTIDDLKKQFRSMVTGNDEEELDGTDNI